MPVAENWQNNRPQKGYAACNGYFPVGKRTD